MPTKQTVQVTLTKSPDPEKMDDSLKVDVPLLEIFPGDELEFIFTDCENPVIMIPVERVFTENRATDNKKSGTITMKVLLDPKFPKRRFPYMVFSANTDVLAEGKSPPRMVLKQP